MLYISKWKAMAILLTAFICLPASPFPTSFRKRPSSAGRFGRSVTSCSGSICRAARTSCSQVDANDVRRQKLETLQDDVRKLLREARVGLHPRPRHPGQFRRGALFARAIVTQALRQAARIVAAARRLSRQHRAALGRYRRMPAAGSSG